MKKYIIAIVIMVGLLSVPSVYAGVIKPLFTSVSKDYEVSTGGLVLREQGLNVVKFVDGSITCYTSITKINGITANTSISCVK